MDWARQCCIIIPCHNESAGIRALVCEAKRYLACIVVVDDGSSDATAQEAEFASAIVLRHSHCLGKGAALQTGIHHARSLGFEWAILMDGDGQHAPADIPFFLSFAEREPADLIVGNRMLNVDRMPSLRRWANQTMSRMLSRASGVALPDSQCGFRFVRIRAWCSLTLGSRHFEIESEALVEMLKRGFSVRFIPVQTLYGSPSKIRVARDTIRWIRWWRRTRAEFARAGGSSRLRPGLSKL